MCDCSSQMQFCLIEMWIFLSAIGSGINVNMSICQCCLVVLLNGNLITIYRISHVHLQPKTI